MAKVTPITEQFQHFVSELKESFWSDLQGQVQQSMGRLFELLSERQRDLYMGSPRHSRQKPRRDYRNGYYERDFVSRFGSLRLRIARPRQRGFLPAVLQKFQRRAEEVSLLIREAFLRGISTREVGRLVAILTGETVSPQTVSRLSRDRDEAVRQFHQAPLQDEWAYLFLDGVSLRLRRPSGRQRVRAGASRPGGGDLEWRGPKSRCPQHQGHAVPGRHSSYARNFWHKHDSNCPQVQRCRTFNETLRLLRFAATQK